MKLLSLHHYGLPWPETTVTGTDLAITGAVGAGKSALADLVEIALVGECPRGKLSSLTSKGGVTITFAVGEETYRRTVTQRAKASGASLERLDASGLEWVTIEKTPAEALGIAPELLSAALFTRCHGSSGHGTFGPSTPTQRRTLLGLLDAEVPPTAFPAWSAELPAKVGELVNAIAPAGLRASACPALATDAARKAKAKADAALSATSRADELDVQIARDRAALAGPEPETVDVAAAEAALADAQHVLAVARQERERIGHLLFAYEQAARRRADAEAALKDVGDPVGAATAKLEAARAAWTKAWDSLAHARAEALRIAGEAEAIEVAAKARADAEARVFAAEAAVARLRETGQSVVVPCGYADRFKGCVYLVDNVKAREALPAAEAEVTAARAALAAVPSVNAAEASRLRRDAAQHTVTAEACKARLGALRVEAEGHKATIAAGDPSGRLRAIATAELPPEPGGLPDLSGYRAEVERCQAVAVEARRASAAATAATALRKSATERLTGAEVRASTLRESAARDRAEGELWAQVERWYREAPRFASDALLADIAAGANAFLSRNGFSRTVAVTPTKADAGGKWGVAVTVDGKPREQLSEGQLMQVDLALSAGLRAVLGLDWSVIDDGFGALGEDVARVVGAVSTGWVISHEKTIDGAIDALTARGFGVLRVGGAT